MPWVFSSNAPLNVLSSRLTKHFPQAWARRQIVHRLRKHFWNVVLTRPMSGLASASASAEKKSEKWHRVQKCFRDKLRKIFEIFWCIPVNELLIDGIDLSVVGFFVRLTNSQTWTRSYKQNSSLEFDSTLKLTNQRSWNWSHDWFDWSIPASSPILWWNFVYRIGSRWPNVQVTRLSCYCKVRITEQLMTKITPLEVWKYLLSPQIPSIDH